ncbi:MAG: hypothetical protein HYR85_10935 [Planctomycetes bacterium]|nr:hypothetical protein [Planctomycetota bacterium]MBI3843403.1 hypothetical protein [Planctomycetota bacterium]
MKSKMLCFGLLIVSVAGLAIAHPHVVRQIQLPLQKGQLEVKYFTVPYDAKTLEGLPTGLYWHLGFANFKVMDEPLNAGATSVAPGSYRLFAHSEKDQKWSLVLISEANGQKLAMTTFGMLAAKDEAKKKELMKTCDDLAQGMIVLPTAFTKGGDKTEHLRIGVEDLGQNFGDFQGPGAGSSKSLGHDFMLRVDFGDLHGTVALSEPAPEGAKKESGGK